MVYPPFQRGIQYCYTDYVNYLKGSNINISMTENGDLYEAALEATKVTVYKYINKHPHRSVDFMLPVDAHKESGPLKKHWKKREFDTTEKSASENKTGKENQG